MGSNHMNEQFRNQKGRGKKTTTNKKTTKESEKPYTENWRKTPVKPREVENYIPMYDPQTGEANPYYEELTGKKNPLLEMRKNNKVDMLIPSFEPKKNNRYKVKLPEHFAIPDYCVAKTSRPKISVHTKSGIIGMGVKQVWENITFEFYDPIQPSISETLITIIENFMDENFKYTLEMMDSTGKTIETLEISECEIISIDLGDLGYDSDQISRCKMTIKPGQVKLKK